MAFFKTRVLHTRISVLNRFRLKSVIAYKLVVYCIAVILKPLSPVNDLSLLTTYCGLCLTMAAHITYYYETIFGRAAALLAANFPVRAASQLRSNLTAKLSTES